MLGLGLLAGLCGAATSRGTLVALPIAWLIGGVVGMWWPGGGALPLVTTVTFGSVGLLMLGWLSRGQG